MLQTRNKSLWSLLGAAALIAIGSSRAAATNIAACGTFGADSYTVINNISSAGISCLIFNAGPVTLDLGGFTVSGSGNSNGVLANVIANVTVRNGTIKGFARGVFANGAGAIIDGVRAITGADNGFTVGDNGTVENSLITGHSVGGILAGKNATIVGNTISGTAGVMIAVSTASYVKGNVITQNTSGGTSHAIQVDSDCKVLDNAISNKTSHPDVGIAAKNLNLISGNTITGFIVGIRGGDSNVITGNSASNNFSGIECASGCLVNNNTANNNSGSSSTEGGIIAGQESQVTDNVAKGNIGQGIAVTCPSKVADNTALSNFTNLSETGTGCLTTGNLAP